jgi:hypothetical protein
MAGAISLIALKADTSAISTAYSKTLRQSSDNFQGDRSS